MSARSAAQLFGLGCSCPAGRQPTLYVSPDGRAPMRRAAGLGNIGFYRIPPRETTNLRRDRLSRGRRRAKVFGVPAIAAIPWSDPHPYPSYYIVLGNVRGHTHFLASTVQTCGYGIHELCGHPTTCGTTRATAPGGAQHVGLGESTREDTAGAGVLCGHGCE